MVLSAEIEERVRVRACMQVSRALSLLPICFRFSFQFVLLGIRVGYSFVAFVFALHLLLSLFLAILILACFFLLFGFGTFPETHDFFPPVCFCFPHWFAVHSVSLLFSARLCHCFVPCSVISPPWGGLTVSSPCALVPEAWTP